MNYYHLNFQMMQHHKYSLTELENMMPWEREIYVSLLKQWVDDENQRIKEEQAKMADVVGGPRSVSDLDEAPGSYKDINTVMENQSDLVEILVTLTPIANMKG